MEVQEQGFELPCLLGPEVLIASATGPLCIQEWPHPAGKRAVPQELDVGTL